jgi:diguanylate cyclase (GGDEF)-like protein
MASRRATALLATALLCAAVGDASVCAQPVASGLPASPIAFVPSLSPVSPRLVGAVGAVLVSALLLLLYFYRRRLYILYWIGGWVLTAGSLFLAGHRYAHVKVGWFAYGLSQFLAITAPLVFVLSADAYVARPRLRREYAIALLALLLWFGLSPLALDSFGVYAPGHLLTAGALAAAGLAHLVLLRRVWLLGAAATGAMLIGIAAVNAWMAIALESPDAPGANRALYVCLALYFAAALGMQLMTFEDMTYELRTTNVQLATAQAEMRQLVITDSLTGCRNRRFFDEVIDRELKRHRRYGVPLSLLFVDVDRFKAINDTFGHEAGDHVLREVAAFLTRSVREADYVFRWGGDEFLILISCCEEEARRRAAALQLTFSEAAQEASLPPGVGLSVGCVEVPAGCTDIKPYLKAADERMYVRKRAAR